MSDVHYPKRVHHISYINTEWVLWLRQRAIEVDEPIADVPWPEYISIIWDEIFAEGTYYNPEFTMAYSAMDFICDYLDFDFALEVTSATKRILSEQLGGYLQYGRSPAYQVHHQVLYNLTTCFVFMRIPDYRRAHHGSVF